MHASMCKEQLSPQFEWNMMERGWYELVLMRVDVTLTVAT